MARTTRTAMWINGTRLRTAVRHSGSRGGGWGSSPGGLAAVEEGYLPPDFQDSSVGFRVASVPEPATLFLVFVGAAALFGLELS